MVWTLNFFLLNYYYFLSIYILNNINFLFCPFCIIQYLTVSINYFHLKSQKGNLSISIQSLKFGNHIYVHACWPQMESFHESYPLCYPDKSINKRRTDLLLNTLRYCFCLLKIWQEEALRRLKVTGENTKVVSLLLWSSLVWWQPWGGSCLAMTLASQVNKRSRVLMQ